MTKRRGLTHDEVVEAAMTLVEAESASALTLSRLAQELNVKPPSLYNHVDGLDAVRRAVGVRVMGTFADRLGKAAMGRARRDAVRAISAEFRSYVTAHPHLYEFSTQARPEDEEYAAAAMRSIEPVVAVLRGYELDDTEAIHAARAFRSALHGFVSLEIIGGFGIDIDIDRSFDWLVDRFATMLEPPSV